MQARGRQWFRPDARGARDALETGIERRRGPSTLRSGGCDDPELLGVVDDLADENGWTSTLAIRVQLGEHVEEVGHRTGVGPRLGWMRRYGWLERSPETGEWRLTAMGHAILDNPSLSKTVEKALEGLRPEAAYAGREEEIAEYGSGGPAEIRSALRRADGTARWGARDATKGGPHLAGEPPFRSLPQARSQGEPRRLPPARTGRTGAPGG